VATPTLPHAAAISPDGTKLYVARGSTVDVFDTSRLRVLASTVPDALVHALAASPDGRVVFSASTGRVDVLEAMRLRSTGAIATMTGEARAYMAVSPDGGMLLVSGPPAPSPIDRFSRVTLIRLLDGSPLWTLWYRDTPVFGGVAFSPDGALAYLVADVGGKGVLWQFGVTTGPSTAALDAPIDLPRYPTRVAVSPDGTNLFIVHDGAQSLSRVDLTTRRVTSADVTAPAVALAYTPNGEQVYVATKSGVFALRADSGEIVVGPIAVAGEPRMITMDPFGERAYVLHADPNGISAIGTAAVAMVPADR
jgi:DNA-binding beta-propeller fold protein YncE